MDRRLPSLAFLLVLGCPNPSPIDDAGASLPDAGALDASREDLDAPPSLPDAARLDASATSTEDAFNPCGAGELDCGSGCIDVTEDEAHCGGCGVACGGDESCFFGVCQPATCGAGTERCLGACVDTAVDASHCGSCEHACADGEVCRSGVCTPACAAPSEVCEMDGVSLCTDTDTDREHCGTCDTLCGAGASCAGGTCACRGRDVEMCDGACVNTSTDASHCGGCGVRCSHGACSGGVCSCRAGTTLCAVTQCVDLDTNSLHCGRCGQICGRGTSCVGGSCVSSTCAAGRTLCGGSCVDLQTDETHCGACTTSCPAGTECVAGLCPPPNDERANATVITPSLSEVTVMGTTVGASFDGPSVPCACASARNVWYRFELTGDAVVYFDTFGSGATDTEIHVTTGSGTLLPGGLPWIGPPTPGACNDDAECSGGGWSAGASRTAALLGAGTWNVAVGSCSPGAFTLHMQMLPSSLAQEVFSTAMPFGSVEHRLPVGSEGAPACGGGSSGETMHWFLSCGGGETLLSLCRSDEGRWERNDDVFGPFRDPLLTVRSAASGSDVACVDDSGGAGGIDCRGLSLRVNPFLGVPQFFLDGHHYAPRFQGSVPRGLAAAIVDEAESSGGLDYTLVHRHIGASFP